MMVAVLRKQGKETVAMRRQKGMNETYLPVFFRADTAERKIAVTVDDCDEPEILRRMVRLFDRHGAGLTLFPIGRNFSGPGMAELIRDCVFEKGVEIENHTMNHARIFRLPEPEMAREIWEQGLALDRLLGVNYRQHFFRPMGGDGFTDRRTHNYLIQLGFRGIAEWTCCGSDTEPEEILDRLCPGAIYLFHTIEGDAEKLEKLLPYAAGRGYRFVTLNGLLGFRPNEITAYRPLPMPVPRAYTDDRSTCRRGDYTWNVFRMQKKLMALNLLVIDDGRPTGYYGALTEAAVRRFQELRGLPATGEADAETQELLLPDSGSAAEP